MTIYTDIDNTAGDRQLLFSVSGPTVRITLRQVDGFDADEDTFELLGDFNLEVLRHRLAGLHTHTGATPTASSASRRPGRRKPRWWRRG